MATVKLVHFFKLFLLPLMVALVTIKSSNLNEQHFNNLYLQIQHNLLTLTILFSGLTFISTIYFLTRPKPIYLIDYSCHLPPPHQKATTQRIIDSVNKNRKDFSPDEVCSVDFFIKVLERSGLGDETSIPETLFNDPPLQTMAVAREETQQVIFDAIDNLIVNTKVNPREIGIIENNDL